jgi:hypothetical protein
LFEFSDVVNVSDGFGHLSLMFAFEIAAAGGAAERGVVLRGESRGTIPPLSGTSIARSRPNLSG